MSLFGVVLAGHSAGVLAAEPTAIVEEIKARGTTVQSFDYVGPGDVVKLGGDEVLVLGYFASCIRETITGGTVTIGARQSEIAAGRISRQQVACDPAVATLAVAQAAEVGGSVIRALDVAPAAGPLTIRIFSTTPVLKVSQPAERLVVIERLDRPAPSIELKMTGSIYDLAEVGISLDPGGRYAVQSGTTERRVFQIDPQAQRGGGPVVSRLVAF